jgi:hypothetical protein
MQEQLSRTRRKKDFKRKVGRESANGSEEKAMRYLEVDIAGKQAWSLMIRSQDIFGLVLLITRFVGVRQ